MSYEAVAENSKHLARKYSKEGNFGRAFSHYLVSLKLKPEWRYQLQEEFKTVLCKWGPALEARKKYQDLFFCYEQAVEVFPDDALILNNLGSHLLRCGLLKEASHYFQKCLAINPRFIRASRNLENVLNLAVERWHFRMLNDRQRNEAFREAIIKKINQGFQSVLDVGTGTGILSLFSAEGKAKQVYASECSSVMIELAEQVFRSNNTRGIKLIKKHSSEIRIPEDVPEKVSLLVTETFDAGLLGEDILNTLSHAWKHLLRPPPPRPGLFDPEKCGLVLPMEATVYVTGIELDAVANDIHLWDHPFGNVKILRNCGDYDTLDLSRTQFRRLIETEEVFRIDFNDPNKLEDMLTGMAVVRSLRCKTSGRLDCFAIWFDLQLDEDIRIRTDPTCNANSAWDQVIFPLSRSITVLEDQVLGVTVSFENQKLNVSLDDFQIEEPKFEASDDVVRILNEKKLTKAFREVAETLSETFNNPVDILDCYSFPLFGLIFLMNRKNRYRDKLTCFVPTEEDRCLLMFLIEKYEVEGEVVVKTDTCLEDCLPEDKYDIILLNLIDVNGEIKDGVLLQLNYIKSLLKPAGILLPMEATLMGQFVYSEWLWMSSEVVDDSVTCGYKIAQYINKFRVRHFIDLDLNTVEKTACSEPFELFSLLDYVERTFEGTVPRLPTARLVNAMTHWLRIKFTKGCNEFSTLGNSLYHQGAILFPTMELPEEIKFNIVISDGLFNVELFES